MLDNCKYDKIKLLHEMSSMAWFIERHAKENAEKVGNKECIRAYGALKKNLEKNIELFKKMLNIEHI